MNRVKIEENSDGTFILTPPGGGQRHNLSAADVAKSLKEEEQKYQAVVDDLKAKREEFEKRAAKA